MERYSDYMRIEERDDISLLKDVARGNPEAYSVLLDRYLEIISTTSFRILCDRTDSEAVTVRVFVSLWYDVLEYDDRFGLREWLLRRTCMYSIMRIARRRILRLAGIRDDVFVRASPKVDDADDYQTKLAWELYCRASAHMTYLQSVSYALCALDEIDNRTVALITGLSGFRIALALKRAEGKVQNELRRYHRESDYDRYLDFLKKVAEGLTDRSRLVSDISGKVGFFSK